MSAGACQPTQHEGADMPIMQSCPACGAPCHVPDELRGQLYSCAACGAEFLTRAPDPMPSADSPTPPPSDSMQRTRVIQWMEKEAIATPDSSPGPLSGTRVSDAADDDPKVILDDFHVIKKLGEG